jgi:hypothetical protein
MDLQSIGKDRADWNPSDVVLRNAFAFSRSAESQSNCLLSSPEPEGARMMRFAKKKLRLGLLMKHQRTR